MRLAHVRRSVQIGDGPCHPQHPVIAPCGQPKALGHPQQQIAPRRIGRGDLFQQLPLGIGIDPDPVNSIKPFGLHGAGCRHACGYDRRTVAGFGQVEVAERHGRHFDPQVKAVHQRAGYPPHVFLATDRHPGAGPGGVGQIAAFTGVCRGHQHEPAGIADMRVGPRHHHLAGFNRLAQGFQHGTRKLGELVHEQHAVMRQRDFAGFGTAPAPHNCCHRCGVVRVAERPRPADPTFGQQP